MNAAAKSARHSRVPRLEVRDIGAVLLSIAVGATASCGAEQIHHQRRHVLEDGRVQRIDQLLAAPLAAHEPGVLEDVEVVGHRSLREIERPGQLTRRPRAALQELEHLAAARVGQRLEDLVRAHDGGGIV
jgi:hypothetical protein